LRLWWVPTITNSCANQHLQPIMADDIRQSIHNILPVLEMRPTLRGKKFGRLYKL
jgi:hypothetical protein